MTEKVATRTPPIKGAKIRITGLQWIKRYDGNFTPVPEDLGPKDWNTASTPQTGRTP